MLTVQAGETWRISLAGARCDVKVTAPSGSPSWWHCVDLNTGLSFLVCDAWFVERVPGPEPQPGAV